MDTQATPLRDLLATLESPSDAYLHALTPHYEEWQKFLSTKGHELDIQMTKAPSAANFNTKMARILTFIQDEYSPEFLQALHGSIDDITLLHNSALITAQYFRRQYPSGNKLEEWQTVCATNENITLPKAVMDVLINNDSIRLSLLERLNTDIHRGAQILRTPAESISARSAQAPEISPVISFEEKQALPKAREERPAYSFKQAVLGLVTHGLYAFYACTAGDLIINGYDDSYTKRAVDSFTSAPQNTPKP